MIFIEDLVVTGFLSKTTPRQPCLRTRCSIGPRPPRKLTFARKPYCPHTRTPLG
ncbi:hypothetical protein HanRHA438_Chr17g0831891 [Helianthus annuus]|nr:hypothetical protein HanIR_Chr17g0892271 [Helianthus annuus]KAJ0669029.1 hypothetical protein HanPI659440_Chr17g0696421 [Helianthus annuus]KAJ0827968.1 hypothetical protein HanRHA438_Chr17g0831891 [Helianthus annuus]